MNWFYYVFSRFSGLDLGPIEGSDADSAHLQTIVNTVLAITGAIAVLVIVVAGFRYIISQGDPNAVSTSKNAIIYSLVGLVVIIAAFAIVNFVVLGVG